MTRADAVLRLQILAIFVVSWMAGDGQHRGIAVFFALFFGLVAHMVFDQEGSPYGPLFGGILAAILLFLWL